MGSIILIAKIFNQINLTSRYDHQRYNKIWFKVDLGVMAM